MSEMNKPQVFKYTCNRHVGSRYVATHRMARNGWVLIKNKSTSDTIHISVNEGDRIYASIRPLHVKPIQFDNMTVITISSAVSGTQVLVEESIYKPELDVYWHDEEEVENIPYCAQVAITTTYSAAALLGTNNKGYATYIQIVANVGTGFIGTVEMSSDNSVTWSSPVPINEGDPMKKAFEEFRVITNVRIVRIAGTATFYMR